MEFCNNTIMNTDCSLQEHTMTLSSIKNSQTELILRMILSLMISFPMNHTTAVQAEPVITTSTYATKKNPQSFILQ